MVYIFLVQFLAKQFYSFTEALEVYHFPLPQEFNHIVHIGIIAEAKDIIIGYTRFLFWERIA